MQTATRLEVPYGHDTWAHGDHGSFWGSCGAAGMLVTNERSEVLLQLRSAWCHEGGTWGIPGGARMSHESPVAAALRETDEEHGLSASMVHIHDTHTLDYGYWSYVTVLAELVGDWHPTLRTNEAESIQWVPLNRVTQLRLHPGFSTSWPQLHQRLLARKLTLS